MDLEELSGFFTRLDRAYFMDNEYKEMAHLDGAFPIGWGQTISQPSLVLDMTRRLDPDKNGSVLEIGTGSGYQTALLAEFSGTVYTIERIPELARRAKEKLDALGYANIVYKTGDGSLGWPEHAPFARIITTAAAGEMPADLIGQLAPGGRMVAPVGPPGMQDLLLITKDADGKTNAQSIEKVTFVEMKGKYGWKE
jgi:protein-L-isoaspartate(D-aspartate) O-methyltransferase